MVEHEKLAFIQGRGCLFPGAGGSPMLGRNPLFTSLLRTEKTVKARMKKLLADAERFGFGSLDEVGRPGSGIGLHSSHFRRRPETAVQKPKFLESQGRLQNRF